MNEISLNQLTEVQADGPPWQAVVFFWKRHQFSVDDRHLDWLKDVDGPSFCLHVLSHGPHAGTGRYGRIEELTQIKKYNAAFHQVGNIPEPFTGTGEKWKLLRDPRISYRRRKVEI